MVKMDIKFTFVAVTVRDAKVMLDFYQNILGLEMGYTDSADKNVIKHYLKIPGGTLKILAPLKPPEIGPRDVMGVTGYRLFTFVVNNMMVVCHALEAKGVRFAVKPQALPDGSSWAVIVDPEGNSIEISGTG